MNIAQPGLEPDVLSPEIVRAAVHAIKVHFLRWREPPLELPADWVIEAAAREILTMQPALDAAREAGRREGLAQAAAACDAIHADRIYGAERHMAWVCSMAVQRLATPTTTPDSSVTVRPWPDRAGVPTDPDTPARHWVQVRGCPPVQMEWTGTAWLVPPTRHPMPPGGLAVHYLYCGAVEVGDAT